MVWLWGSKEKKPEEAKSELEFTDPSLKEFYSNSKPPTPVALASPETRSHYDPVEHPTSIANTSSSSEVISTTYSHLGTGAVELKGGSSRKVSLQQAARDNCVEFEIALSNCIIKGSIWDRFLSCRTQHMNQQKCTELQEYALAVLGFNAALNDAQRRSIQGKADDLLIEYAPESRLTEDICERFKAAVDQHQTSSVSYRS